MRLLSINKEISYQTLDITYTSESELSSQDVSTHDYIIISGGDGTIRRVMKQLQHIESLPPFIINPTGSFNVIAKFHRVAKLDSILEKISTNTQPKTATQNVYSINEEVFLFSAGNMGDLQHIFLAETLRFGILKNGMAKYVLAILLLLPTHIILTPFMLLSKKKFFIFTPASFIRKFGRFYGKVEKKIVLDLENNYNLVELDGDVVTIEESVLNIKPIRSISIITR
jgi:hypothetical protein